MRGAREATPAVIFEETPIGELREVVGVIAPELLPGERLSDAVRRAFAAAKRPRLMIASPEKPTAGSAVVKAFPEGPLAYLTSQQVLECCPALTMPALKKLMFRSRTNGLEEHLVRNGRRVYFKAAGLKEWLDHRGAAEFGGELGKRPRNRRHPK